MELFSDNGGPVPGASCEAVPTVRRFLANDIDGMLKEEITKPATTEWVSAVVFAENRGSLLCLCVNYQKLNAVTAGDVYPLPWIDESTNSLRKAPRFSARDAKSGYRQVKIDEPDRSMIIFTSPYDLNQFVRMIFRIKTGLASSRRRRKIILHSVRLQLTLIYPNDILVFPENVEEHHDHFQCVLTLLSGVGVGAKLNEC